MGVLQQLALTPSVVRTASLRRVPAVMGGLNAIEKKHPHEPHWYLLALGVEPELQGRAIGTQLMAPVLERCDREGTPAYLESSKERNVPLYERNGFRVTEEFRVPNGGPPIWLMWRDPR
jgi:GNAT superfamily N-acetyltransferase